MSRSSARIAPLAAVFAINGAVYGSLLPRYPQLADQVGASAGEFGVALAGIGLGGVTGALVATRVIRLVGGPVPALFATGTAFLLAAIAVASAPSLGLLTLAFTALGLFDGFVDTAMNQAGGAMRARLGASVMGRLHATLAAATVAATALGAATADVVPLQLHLAVVATLLFVLLLTSLRALRTELPSRAADAPGDDRDVHARSRTRPRRRTLWWAVVVGAGLAAVLVELPAQEWSALLLSRELSATSFVAGLGPLVAVAGVLVGRLSLDHAVNAFGWRIVIRAAGIVTSVGLVAGLGVSAATETVLPLLVGLGVSAVGAGVAVPLLFDRSTHLAVRVGLAPESGPGLVSGTFRIGVLVSPLLIGGVAEIAGLFVALALAAVAGAVSLPTGTEVREMAASNRIEAAVFRTSVTRGKVRQHSEQDWSRAGRQPRRR
ncbi:MFS transporter [Agreia pratensis]|uniref:Major Facilitator Superfamily protein n=1 Tax=Agreia pratensis TaxID=150121 RepID=A0A1X7IX99_9MICO|nr:MFS transporter [Agreia pratensis]SMG19844.1 Major Facilitator Superfamily protein [Agreia pratensis]